MKKYFFFLIFILGLSIAGFLVFAQPKEDLPPSEEELCLMVLTSARNPETGVCIVFSTSCIPEGWEKVDKCPAGSRPFPVAELGNCKNEAECMAYCEKSDNMLACINFAEAQGLISSEEARMARKMLEMGDTGGPGGCKGKAECEAYCDNPDHMEECIIFAKKYGLIPPDELEDVEKVLAAIKKGYRPPACHGKAACDAYCAAPEHFEECITFGEAAGLIPPDEIDDAKKALEAVRKGAKLPNCKGRAECDAYCVEPEHLEECLTFAEAAGFISSEDAAMARKTGGKGPGDCRGKEACEAYCEDPSHAEECVDFAVKYGFMPSEEAENAKKMLKAGLTGGPGGCKGKEECEVYCNDLTHMEECVDFALKAGFMTAEEAEQAKKMAQMGINIMEGGPGGCKGKEECDAYCQDPAHMEECVEFGKKMGMIPSEEVQQIEAMMRGGPGGCKTEEECKAYCEDPAHGEECLNFAVEQGFMSPEEAQRMREMMQQGPSPGMMAPPPTEGGIPPEGVMPPEGGMPPTQMPTGPGGCTSEAECIQYCSQPEHFQECQQFAPPSGGTTPPPGEITPPPPSETPPQSFFDQVRNFLASLLSVFGF